MLNDIIFEKQASLYKEALTKKEKKEEHSILPVIAGGAGLIVAGKGIHNLNKIIQRHKSVKAFEELLEHLERNPKKISEVAIPEEVAFLRDSNDIEKYVNSYGEYIKRQPETLAEVWQEMGAMRRKEYAEFAAKSVEGSPGVFVSGKTLMGWKGPNNEPFLKPFVYVPKSFEQFGGQILEHELGHYDQYRTGYLDKNDTAPQRIKGYFKSLVNPKEQTLYKIESDAWDRAGYSLNDPARMGALQTYENNAKLNRTHALAVASGIGGAGIIGNALINQNENNNRKPNK